MKTAEASWKWLYGFRFSFMKRCRKITIKRMTSKPFVDVIQQMNLNIMVIKNFQPDIICSKVKTCVAAIMPLLFLTIKLTDRQLRI